MDIEYYQDVLDKKHLSHEKMEGNARHLLEAAQMYADKIDQINAGTYNIFGPRPDLANHLADAMRHLSACVSDFGWSLTSVAELSIERAKDTNE